MFATTFLQRVVTDENINLHAEINKIPAYDR